MNVLGRMVGMKNQSFDIGRVEVKHAGFTMIDPDDGMVVRLAHAGVLSDARVNGPASDKVFATGTPFGRSG